MSTLATWWGKRWAEAIAVAAPEPRPRGRVKIRGAKLRGLDAKTGEATIEVTTASVLPYEVRISVVALPEEAWAQATAALRGRAVFAAKLLAGDMPPEIEDAFAGAGGSLFPKPGEVRVRCNCPAGSGGCRHGSVAEKTLAEAIDRDPFLLFDLRGRPRAEVLSALGLEPTAPPPSATAPTSIAELTPADPAAFRRARGDLFAFRFHIEAPSQPLLNLTRLGDPPGWRAAPLLETLGPVVQNAAAKAREIALTEEPDAPSRS